MKAKLAKGVKIITSIVEWIIVACLVVVFFSAASPLLPTKKYATAYVIPSGSMEPTIKVGSIAIVQPADGKIIQKGDIIAFTSPDNPKQIILHRVYDVSNKNNAISYRTKGDNNNTPDNWSVPTVFLKGKMLFAIPYLGYLVTFIKTPRGFALFIGIPALFLLLLQIRKIKEGIEEEVRRRTAKYIEEEKKRNSMKPPIPLIILLLLLLITVGILPIAYARFTAAATIHNVAFTTAASPTTTPTPTARPTPTPTQTQTPTPTPKPTPTCPHDVTIINSGESYTTSVAIANTGKNIVGGDASGSGSITTGDATAESVVNTTVNSTTIHCPASGIDNKQ